LKLTGEEVAEFDYRPVACKKAYRLIVLKKKLVAERGQLWLFEPDRFFFHITNDGTTPASEIVFLANDRCDQENLIGQLKGGVKALAMPVDDLVSSGACMVMAGLAWSLKAWAASLARARSLGGEVPCREAIAVADGVRHVLRRDDPGSLPGLAWCAADRLSAAVLEPVAGHFPAVGGAAARSPPGLSLGRSEAGVWKPRSSPYGRRADERGCADGSPSKKRCEPGDHGPARRWSMVCQAGPDLEWADPITLVSGLNDDLDILP
jgi:hypothetical protein